MSPDEPRFELLLRMARHAEVEPDLLIECIERRLVPRPGSAPDVVVIEAACRVRRLTALGVNLPGVEMVTHMRSRMIRVRQERDRLRAELEALRRQLDALSDAVLDLDPLPGRDDPHGDAR